MMRKAREIRINPETRIELLAECEGWCLVRRPGHRPFVMTAKSYSLLLKEPTPDSPVDEGLDG